MASTIDGLFYGGWTAGADLSGSRFRFVTAASGAVDETGAGLRADGILENDPALGQAAVVRILGGVAKVECGGDVTANADITSDANGRAVDSTADDVILGKALEAGAVGEVIQVITFSTSGYPTPT